MKKRIYLYENGSLVRKDNNLCYETKERTIYLPVYQIETINIFNHFNLNKNTIIILNRHKITINFFDYYGNYIGSYFPYTPIHGKNIQKQVLFLNDNKKRLYLAKDIIASSMYNMLSFVKYHNKKGKKVSSQLEQLQRLYNEFIVIKEHSNIIDDLLLSEAKYKQLYYSCFSEITSNTFFKFIKRTIRPPKDAINALMSYGYTLLYAQLSNIIHRSRLHISLPIIHGSTRNIEGLQYDIADIFKPVLIDRLIFRLINKKQINETYFNVTNEYVYLTKEGARIFIEEFEQSLSKTIFIEDSKRYLSYRNILSLEVHKISNHIFNKKIYKGFKMSW